MAAAAFVAALAVAALVYVFAGDGNEVEPAQKTVPTTVAPDVETLTDLEVIEAGVAAVYSGDAERAAELFQLAGDSNDDQIRADSAYQAAIGGRLTLNCLTENTPGVVTCYTQYHNAMSDAIGYHDDGYRNRIVVEDGVITEFEFGEHTWAVESMWFFLDSEGRLEGYEDCTVAPFPESCATIQLENLDAWAAWYETNR